MARWMAMKTYLRKAAIVFSLAFGFAMAAAAQGGTAEIAAGGGMASFHDSGSSITKGKFAASIAWNAADDFAFAFEYGYTPLYSNHGSISGATGSSSGSMQTYGGVARVSMLAEHRVRPYFLFTGGGAEAQANASVTSGGVTTTASASQSGSYIGFGGGVNLRLGGGFGARPEVRYQRVDISGALNELDLTGSLYYTFGHHRK